MAAGAARTLAIFLLFINLVMYGIITFVAGWAIQYGINHTYEKASILTMPASILTMPASLFPIYFPIGNMATGFFVIFSLIAGLVGVASSISGINNILQWNASNLLSAATTSTIAWSLTLLAMGLACKEINIGDRASNLRALETFTIILSGTQLVCIGAIHSGVKDVIA